MELSRTSGLKIYSIGIVTENKAFGSDVIKVCPIEEFSLEEGKLEDDTKSLESSLPDINGVVKTAKIKGSAVLEARWTPWGNSNRDTAPDVRKSETVLIYRYADTQDYYWDTIFREPELRRLEHVRHAYSNKPSGIDAYDTSSSYWVEYSTAEKRIKLHTSDNDGEACTYDLWIDTKEGIVKLLDGFGNSIELQSGEGNLNIKTNKEVWTETKTFIVDGNLITRSGSAESTTDGYKVHVKDAFDIDTHDYFLDGTGTVRLRAGKFQLESNEGLAIKAAGGLAMDASGEEIKSKAEVVKTQADIASKSSAIQQEFATEQKKGDSIKYICSDMIYLDAPNIILNGKVTIKTLEVEKDIHAERVYTTLYARDEREIHTPSYNWAPTYDVEN